MPGFSNLTVITPTIETENPSSGRTNPLAPPLQLPLRFQRIRTTMNSIQSCPNNSVTWTSLQSHVSIAANVDTSNATANPHPKAETNVSISARTISERRINLARLRTGHCSLNQYLHRFGIEESPLCSCGNGA